MLHAVLATPGPSSGYPLVYLLVFALCFMLGSIPWGLVLSKLFYGKDLRDEGSGNIGTTNAIRTLGLSAGLVVFALDFGKGLLSGLAATLLASIFSPENAAASADEFSAFRQICLALSFLACIWGHIFSPWLGFRGGKGIAVAIGCLFVSFGVLPALAELAIFTVLVLATRYVSAGSIAAAIACPFIAIWVFWPNIPAWFISCLAACTVLWAHRANIKRLIAGEESRFSIRAKED